MFDYHVAEAHANSLQAAASKAGLSFGQLLQLVLQFARDPQTLALLLGVLQAFQGGFDPTKLPTGAIAKTIADAIAKILGKTLPPVPTVTHP